MTLRRARVTLTTYVGGLTVVFAILHRIVS